MRGILCAVVFAICVVAGGERSLADDRLNKLGRQTLSRDQAKQYYKMLQSLDPKLKDRNLFLELVRVSSNKPNYTLSEVLLTVDTHSLDIKTNLPYGPVAPRPSGVPAGAFPAAEVREYFATVAKREALANYVDWLGKSDDERKKAEPKAPADRMAALETKYGQQPWYRADEVLDAEKGGAQLEVKRPAFLLPRRHSNWDPIWQGLATFKIRKDWSDVVASEDLSQTDTPKKSLGDLQGATVSYAHDEKAKEFNGSTVADTWSAVGALILPITWNGVPEKWHFATAMFAPSVSVNRVATSGNPTNEVDHLDFRVGGYGKLMAWPNGLGALQFRGAFVYGTDTGFRASMPAGELDIEPQFLFETGPTDQYEAWRQNWWGIGYRNVLIPKVPRSDDWSDNSLVDWQVRTWLQLEGGHLQRNGAKWDTVDGSFFRLGPTVQGTLNFPALVRGFSINGQYSYMGTVDGPSGRNNLWKVGGALTLYENKTLHQKVSLTADYTKGSLLLSKQPVDVVNVGIGVVF